MQDATLKPMKGVAGAFGATIVYPIDLGMSLPYVQVVLYRD